MQDADSLRLMIFGGSLLVLLLLERAFPRRGEHGRPSRVWSNLGLVAVDSLAVRLLIPLGAVGAAEYAATAGIGLFHQWALPGPLVFVACLLALDALIYAQHRLFHRLPWLWRLHRVHHTDPAFDVTTALRFHPVEILLSMLIKIGAVLALGIPPLAVIVFEIALNACAMFNHADLRLPGWLDRALRTLLVTPDMHRVHHSVDPRETHRNFGFCLSCWDRLFGSYVAQPAAGHLGMRIGQPDHRADRDQRLWALLAQPFSRR